MAQLLSSYHREYRDAKRCKKNWISEIFHFLEIYGHTKDFEEEFKTLLLYEVLDVNMVCMTDDTGDTLLHRAAACGHVTLVAYLLLQPNIHVSALNHSFLKPEEIICTRILASSDNGKKITSKKILHEILSGPTSSFEVFYSCQNHHLKAFRSILGMFRELDAFNDSKQKKKRSFMATSIIQWPNSPEYTPESPILAYAPESSSSKCKMQKTDKTWPAYAPSSPSTCYIPTTPSYSPSYPDD